MVHDHVQGLVKKQALTEEELAAIEQLAAICNAHESLRMRLEFCMLRGRSGEAVHDFLYYEDHKLVGYLSLDSYGSDEKEVVGMVHPEHRRRGIFRSLLNAAEEEGVKRGVEKFVLLCEPSSTAGQACMKAIGAWHEFSEHEMVLRAFREKGIFDDRLLFRKAGADDFGAIVSIMATDFEGDEELARQHVAEKMREPGMRYYLSTFGDESVGCEEPVGTLRLDEIDDETGIYGFVVLPGYRGRGYGRQMLEEVIRMLRAEGQREIMLDVETDNASALGLYRSCGFEVRATYDYYGLDIG